LAWAFLWTFFPLAALALLALLALWTFLAAGAAAAGAATLAGAAATGAATFLTCFLATLTFLAIALTATFLAELDLAADLEDFLALADFL
jgi:hypothetical protein